MRRRLYLALCVVLGLLLQFLAHAGLESLVIRLLVADFDRYSLGLSWADWFIVHHVMTLALLVLGAFGGYALGVRWWRIVYVEKRHWSFRKKKAPEISGVQGSR